MASSIVIVGAGLIGGSIAWRLAQRGANVILADSGTFGGETSRAGAGMLSPGGEFETPSRWLDLGIEGMRLYPGFVAELAEESGLPIDFGICGSKHFADPASARRRAEVQTAAGIRVNVTPGFIPTMHMSIRMTCCARCGGPVPPAVSKSPRPARSRKLMRTNFARW